MTPTDPITLATACAVFIVGSAWLTLHAIRGGFSVVEVRR